jgi:cytochrome c-type biogenesis protein CcmH
MRRLLVLLAALLALAGAGAVVAPAALAAQPRASFNDIEDEVMCDTCNVPLNIADSPRADQERREIRALIAQGLTKEQVKDELRVRYGPAILALPPDSGFTLTAYLVPVAVAVGLLALLLVLLPRWRRRTRADEASAALAVPDLSPGDAARLDDDLARWDAR